MTEELELLTIKHFQKILAEAVGQVTDGKGYERHGMDKEFSEQPWRSIAEHAGIEFLIGQSIKKLMELKSHQRNINKFVPEQLLKASLIDQYDSAVYKWRQDAIGAIVYNVMAIMYMDYQLDKKDELAADAWAVQQEKANGKLSELKTIFGQTKE